ncbi:MAG: protein kinase [Acidobacteriota bacterium]
MAARPLEQLEGKYEILEKIREGGMGAVYKVRHRLLDELRVVKVIRPQLKGDEEIKARFIREARTAIRLRHPNIAQHYDFAIDDEENAFLVMEYIEGHTFEELLRKVGSPPLAVSLEMAQQTLKALAYLHRKGLIHRDIAPDNLILGRDVDGHPLVKLLDLGVAKALRATTSFTLAGTFLGKVRYASPEQFRSHEGAELDERSDLYSFAVVLYELLTGRHPFPGSSLTSLIAGHLLDPPLPFAQSDPAGRVPEELRAAITRSLAKRPAERFASATELGQALAAVQQRFPLLPGVLDEMLAMGDVPTRPISIARPGSTQELLDREFRAGPTPSPEAPPPPAAGLRPGLAAPPARERVPPGADELMVEARVLAELGDRTGALARLAELLASDADHAAARRLQAALEGRAPEKRQQAKAITRAARTVEALFLAGDLAGAEDRLAAALAELGEAEELIDLRRRLSAAREAEVQHRVSECLREARAAAETGSHRDAIARLEQALALDPNDTLVRRVLAHTREELRERDEAEARRLAIATAAGEVESLISAGELAQAGTLLDTAWQALGENPELLAVRERLDRAEATQRSWEEVRKLAEEARALAARLEFTAAFEVLGAAGAAARDDEEIARFVSETGAVVEREAREHRLGVERQQALTAIEDFLERGAWEEAQLVLEVAEKRFPGEAAFLALRHRLDWVVKEARAAAVEGLLHAAVKLADAGRFEHALGEVEEAAGLDPGNPRVAELQGELRRREAVAAIESCLAGGRLAEARRALAVAEKLFPGAPSLAVLRQRLEG